MDGMGKGQVCFSGIRIGNSCYCFSFFPDFFNYFIIDLKHKEYKQRHKAVIAVIV